MKFYQCKNARKVHLSFIIFTTTFFGFFAIDMLGNFGFIVPYSETDRIANGLTMLLFALGGIATYVHSLIIKRYERTIEITQEGIKSHKMAIKWEDVEAVSLYPGFYSKAKRLVYFVQKSPSKAKTKMIWSEYNDEMLVEIKKHWHRRIINEDLYKRYKIKREKKQRK